MPDAVNTGVEGAGELARTVPDLRKAQPSGDLGP